MCEDIFETNPHAALWRSETYVSAREREWEIWTAKVEKRLGHDLDGNDETEGYSMDGAYAAFEAGESVAEYVLDVFDRKAQLARGQAS